MNPEVYSQYVKTINIINALGYMYVNIDDVNQLIIKLKSDIIYTHCINSLYIAIARAYVNHIILNDNINSCPGSVAMWIIQQYSPPEYMDIIAIRNLIFRDYFTSKYCLCGKPDCQFRPPYPLNFPY
jgi:hypothetical protein